MIIALQCFCHTWTGISHRYTYVPSRLNLHPSSQVPEIGTRFKVFPCSSVCTQDYHFPLSNALLVSHIFWYSLFLFSFRSILSWDILYIHDLFTLSTHMFSEVPIVFLLLISWLITLCSESVLCMIFILINVLTGVL